MMTALCTVQFEKRTLSHGFFLFTHRYTTDPQAPSLGKISVNPTFTILKMGVRGSKSHGRAIMMQSYTKFLAFFLVLLFSYMYVCARDRSKNLQSKRNDRVEIAPLDLYGLENLTTVTKINLRAHYVCVHYV